MPRPIIIHTIGHLQIPDRNGYLPTSKGNAKQHELMQLSADHLAKLGNYIKSQKNGASLLVRLGERGHWKKYGYGTLDLLIH